MFHTFIGRRSCGLSPNFLQSLLTSAENTSSWQLIISPVVPCLAIAASIAFFDDVLQNFVFYPEGIMVASPNSVCTVTPRVHIYGVK